MGIGKASDFKIYDEQYFGGQYESISQNVTAFNAASAGALVLTANGVKGDFERESFMKQIAGMVSRRDTAVVTAVADIALAQDENIGVKLNKRIGPVAQTLDAWRKISEDPQLFSFYVGRMVAEQKLQNMVNSAISAVESAIQGQGALVTTLASTIKHNDFVSAMAKLGDQSGQIACWVMHSKPYHDLIGQSITDKIFGVANVTIYAGTVATLGKPTVVIDAPALVDAGAPNTYNTLGLVAGAVEVKESEAETLVFQEVTGLENLVHRLQGEYAYNLRVKGMKYNVASGANPTDATIATPGSWVLNQADVKHGPGVRLVTQ